MIIENESKTIEVEFTITPSDRSATPYSFYFSMRRFCGSCGKWTWDKFPVLVSRCEHCGSILAAPWTREYWLE